MDSWAKISKIPKGPKYLEHYHQDFRCQSRRSRAKKGCACESDSCVNRHFVSSGKSCFNLVKNTAWKVSKYRVISGWYFPVFGLNAEIYFVNLRIQFEYRKIRTRNNSVFGHFSRSEMVRIVALMMLFVKKSKTKIKQRKMITSDEVATILITMIQESRMSLVKLVQQSYFKK